MARVAPVLPPIDSHSHYFNRELSWLAFNQRVLEEACNPAHPLLERLRFLSISGNNLDEFFMVRVAGLKGQQLQNIDQISVDGRSVGQQLAALAAKTDLLTDVQDDVWQSLSRELSDAGIQVLQGADLIADAAVAATKWLDQYFQEEIFPVITPQALDPSHPFPFIPNQGLTLLFDLERLSNAETVRALVMVPAKLPRFVRLPGQSSSYIAIEDVLRYFSQQIFPGYIVREAALFRIIRDSDIEVEEEAEDLVRYFRTAIKRRRRGRVIRLELEQTMSVALETYIKGALGGADSLIWERTGFLGIGALELLVDEDRPDLKFPPFAPRFPERIREYDGDCFAAIRAKDIIVHHPYESFDVVLAFLRQAAADPDVVAIKQTLYRAGKQPTVIRALCDAAEAGKSVTAVVELKARFEEEQNLLWASQLERAGVQVVYGFIDWKTHAKVSMVVRREEGGNRTYCHFGTGNYHPVTARIYTDLSFFTADPRAARDATRMFNYVTGYVEPPKLELLTLSPLGLRARLVELIDTEISNARVGKPAAIWAKMNALVDPAIIDKLYEASNAGVAIDLVIRGVCCLRPGVPDLSENIRVKSVIGRFLEHSRIWAFADGHELPHRRARVFMSSADWMPRNLDRRVEYMLPIENPTVHDQILDQVMMANLIDNEQSWDLQPDGTYVRRTATDKSFNLHRYFMTNPSLSGRGAAQETSDAVPTLRFGRR
jgi:polyphosphate kinase